jgi:hypothetical protein
MFEVPGLMLGRFGFLARLPVGRFAVYCYFGWTPQKWMSADWLSGG